METLAALFAQSPYRLFHLDDAGSVLGPSQAVTAEHDQAAIEQARRGLNGAVLEIWEGSRRIATIRSNDDKPRV